MVGHTARAAAALVATAALTAPAAHAARRAAPAPMAAGDEEGAALDPHRPGRALHARVFHVPQGERLAWEAWEGDAVPSGGHIDGIDVEDNALLTVSRVGIDTPGDRLGAGLALVRYAVAVDREAPPDSILGVRVRGQAAGGTPGEAGAHDWDFAFTVHVVRGDRYLSARPGA